MVHIALLLVLQDFDADYQKLEKDYQAAIQAFFEPLNKAKTEEERKAVKLDFSKYPSKEFIPKFQDLAEHAKGSDAGLSALLWIAQNGMAGGQKDSKPVADAVDAVLTNYLQSSKLEGFASSVRNLSRAIGKEKAEQALRTLIEKSPHREVQASAMFSLAAGAVAESGDDKKAEARKMLESLQKDFADTKYSKQAKGYIFELDHLQVGMTAPDFEAPDLDGKKFKLSDFRGKVVVLDFWGFW